MSEHVTAYVFMKEHSERVPDKNMREIAGKPLYCHIVEKLIKSKKISEILINTDSTRIAESIHTTFPELRVAMREEHLLGDMVGPNELIDSDIKNFNSEHVFQTHSTNPMITVDTINRAIEEYFHGLGKHDSIFSVTAIRKRYFWGDGNAINHDPAKICRTQDLTPIYEENSCFYIFSKNSFLLNNKNRIGCKPGMFEIPAKQALDIDEMFEFEFTKFMLENEVHNG